MLAVNEVKQALRNSNELTSILPATQIFSFNIPKEFNNIGNYCLITDIRDLYNGSASNHSLFLQKTIQIQAWFDQDDPNAEQAKALINEICEDQHYYAVADLGWDLDPDTEQLFFTTEYTKNSIKK